MPDSTVLHKNNCITQHIGHIYITDGNKEAQNVEKYNETTLISVIRPEMTFSGQKVAALCAK